MTFLNKKKLDHLVSGKLAFCCFQIISTCSIWRHFTCVNCGHLRMRISCGTGMHTRSELGSSPVPCGFRSSFFKDGASSLHTRSSKLSHIWHEKKPQTSTAGMFISTVNRVRLRAFACLPGASAVRATTLGRVPFPPRVAREMASAHSCAPKARSCERFQEVRHGQPRLGYWDLLICWVISPPVSWKMEREGPDWCRSCQTILVWMCSTSGCRPACKMSYIRQRSLESITAPCSKARAQGSRGVLCPNSPSSWFPPVSNARHGNLLGSGGSLQRPLQFLPSHFLLQLISSRLQLPYVFFLNCIFSSFFLLVQHLDESLAAGATSSRWINR